MLQKWAINLIGIISWPASSPPIFHFFMKSGKDGNTVITRYSPYQHIYDDFSHETSIVDHSTGVCNVGSPSVVRIWYGKKTKNKQSEDDEDCQVVHVNNGFCPSPSRWANPISGVENARRHCVEGSIANLLYHLGETTLYRSILLSMNQTEAGAIYKIATGCILNDSVTKPRSIVDGHFRDPIMKCLWILELSKKYSFQKVNIEKFTTSRDTMVNADSLALPTILALKSSHNMRFEEQSNVPGNHVTCYW